ncbi:hypothetical protein [Ethanoligenens sp.]|uniref:hypothetical protein n=1 Tax=Ethanoligenens sp. TaxID=2099655 RepID=UPI0039E8E6D0
MTIKELEMKLTSLHIPDNWYFIGGYGNDDQKYCIVSENRQWSVYYSERGARFKENTYSSEQDACEDLFERLVNKLSKHTP